MFFRIFKSYGILALRAVVATAAYTLERPC